MLARSTALPSGLPAFSSARPFCLPPSLSTPPRTLPVAFVLLRSSFCLPLSPSPSSLSPSLSSSFSLPSVFLCSVPHFPLLACFGPPWPLALLSTRPPPPALIRSGDCGLPLPSTGSVSVSARAPGAGFLASSSFLKPQSSGPALPPLPRLLRGPGTPRPSGCIASTPRPGLLGRRGARRCQPSRDPTPSPPLSPLPGAPRGTQPLAPPGLGSEPRPTTFSQLVLFFLIVPLSSENPK